MAQDLKYSSSGRMKISAGYKPRHIPQKIQSAERMA